MSTLKKLQSHLFTIIATIYPSKNTYKAIADKVVCADGTTLSVQASEYHYCTPKSNFGPYTEVEVWGVSAPVTEFEYDDQEPSGYVPIEKVVQLIDNHGGFAE